MTPTRAPASRRASRSGRARAAKAALPRCGREAGSGAGWGRGGGPGPPVTPRLRSSQRVPCRRSTRRVSPVSSPAERSAVAPSSRRSGPSRLLPVPRPCLPRPPRSLARRKQSSRWRWPGFGESRAEARAAMLGARPRQPQPCRPDCHPPPPGSPRAPVAEPRPSLPPRPPPCALPAPAALGRQRPQAPAPPGAARTLAARSALAALCSPGPPACCCERGRPPGAPGPLGDPRPARPGLCSPGTCRPELLASLGLTPSRSETQLPPP